MVTPTFLLCLFTVIKVTNKFYNSDQQKPRQILWISWKLKISLYCQARKFYRCIQKITMSAISAHFYIALCPRTWSPSKSRRTRRSDFFVETKAAIVFAADTFSFRQEHIWRVTMPDLYTTQATHSQHKGGAVDQLINRLSCNVWKNFWGKWNLNFIVIEKRKNLVVSILANVENISHIDKFVECF